MDAAKDVASGFIEEAQPVLRRVIESKLVFEHDFHPRVVTQALLELRKDATVRQQTFRCGSLDNHLYTIGRNPTETELQLLTDLYEERERVLSRNILGGTGELYVRALFRATGAFCGVTQAGRLGSVVDATEAMRQTW